MKGEECLISHSELGLFHLKSILNPELWQ